MKKGIALLGATGSIGRQTLKVMRARPDDFELIAVTAHSNYDALCAIAREFKPKFAGLVEPNAPIDGCECAFGEHVNDIAVTYDGVTDVMAAVVGVAGLKSVMCAINAGRRILLANKEALVVGGAFVISAAQAHNVQILPVDSEHSAIFQCLECGRTPKRIWLTASGGPFRTWQKQDIERASAQDALNHPTWSMGAKVTIDSATMMNKGLEVIEAGWLFDTKEIGVVVHPQSVVHSMVEFADGALLAQLGAPDMRGPISFALGYPNRIPGVSQAISPASLGNLTFEPADMIKFPCLKLAYEAMRAGGYAPCVLNAANEVAVTQLLRGEITVGGIPRLVEDALSRAPSGQPHSIEDLLSADAEIRNWR